MNVCVTGGSSGIGAALCAQYLSANAEVYSLSRTQVPAQQHRHHLTCNLVDTLETQQVLTQLFAGVSKLDLLYLNAGVLGRIQDMSACDLQDLKAQMDVNLWANKTILDFFIHHDIQVSQVIAISSGASVNGSLGWNGYSLSKAALNMLIKLYAKEMPQTHLTALAPGLIDTPMLSSIINGDHDTLRYSSVDVLRQSRDAGKVLTPQECARMLYDIVPSLRNHPSGSFLDIREL